jgi:branched-chain amino acid transport system ATP-binding protein
MLHVDNIHVAFGRMEILKGVSVRVDQGEIVTVLGANGAGKTTLLRAISGMAKPSAGDIFFLEDKVTGLAPKRIVKKGICHVPEGRGLFPFMTVLENLEMGAVTRRDSEEIKKDLEEIFELFPVLKARIGQLAGTLSGGEQQMVTIGRGLMSRPRLCLLDEPSLGLAPNIVKELAGIIQNINSRGTTILVVEQNAKMALNISHRGYIIETGKIVLEGRSVDLMKDEGVKKAYLGI